jgi:hypothetical protein
MAPGTTLRLRSCGRIRPINQAELRSRQRLGLLFGTSRTVLLRVLSMCLKAAAGHGAGQHERRPSPSALLNFYSDTFSLELGKEDRSTI